MLGCGEPGSSDTSSLEISPLQALFADQNLPMGAAPHFPLVRFTPSIVSPDALQTGTLLCGRLVVQRKHSGTVAVPRAVTLPRAFQAVDQHSLHSPRVSRKSVCFLEG